MSVWVLIALWGSLVIIALVTIVIGAWSLVSRMRDLRRELQPLLPYVAAFRAALSGLPDRRTESEKIGDAAIAAVRRLQHQAGARRSKRRRGRIAAQSRRLQ